MTDFDRHLSNFIIHFPFPFPSLRPRPEERGSTWGEKKLEILQSYFKTVVSRDVIERFKIKNEEGLKTLLRLLLNSTSFSVSKLYNTMKSMNLRIGKTTILQYISYVQASYFMHQLLVFSRKMKDQLQYPKKVYFIDNGFITALSLKFSKNMGRFL